MNSLHKYSNNIRLQIFDTHINYGDTMTWLSCIYIQLGSLYFQLRMVNRATSWH